MSTTVRDSVSEIKISEKRRHRHHLDESQRVMVAAKNANLEKRRSIRNAPIGAFNKSQTDASEILNVLQRSIQRAVKVENQAVEKEESDMTHDFNESLAHSKNIATEGWWRIIYQRYFPHFVAMSPPIKDDWGQRGGIDRVITLQGGKTVTVDEKVRHTDYGDILLELWSHYEKREQGWAVKELACDFIAYAILPRQTCYMIPFRSLQKTLYANGNEWEKRFGLHYSKNRNNTTVNMAIPPDVLFDAMNRASRIEWGKEIPATPVPFR